MPVKIVATKSTVQIGTLSIDGYLTDAGRFGMSLSDICRLIGWDIKNGSHILKNKRVKSLADKGFEGSQKVSVSKGGGMVAIIFIEWIPAVMNALARSGVEAAWDFLDTLAGLSLQQLFCDAFGQKFDADDRQEWLKARMLGIEKRNSFTDAIKLWLEQHPEASDNTRKFIYSNVSDLLNRSLTGHNAKHWKDLLGCKSDTLRDHWKPSHLDKISDLEKHAKVLVIRGVHPREAMEAAVTFHEFAIDGNPQGVAS